MSIRAIIVDDEPLAREGLRSFLAEEADIDIEAECEDGEKAVIAIERLRPELVFLDVQMPGLTGFEVLEAVQISPLPAVIFVTAHDEHAIEAFEVSAVDYLLKPFKQERLRKALDRARDRVLRPPGEGQSQIATLLARMQSDGVSPRIPVRSKDRILFLKPGEIDYVEAAGNYVLVHSGKERHMFRETMTALEQRLSAAGFMRLSRSVLVNLNRIREVRPALPGQYSVVLLDGTRLEMTCTLQQLQRRLSQI